MELGQLVQWSRYGEFKASNSNSGDSRDSRDGRYTTPHSRLTKVEPKEQMAQLDAIMGRW